MNYRLKLSVILLVILFSSSLHAAERLLCTVTNDLDSDVIQMVYEMDADQRMITHLYGDVIRNGKKVERFEMNTRELLNGGIILNRKDKYITVRMWSDNFDQERGGILYLDTLYNGVTGERRQYEMSMVMGGANGPALFQNKNEFKQMKFIAKRSPILGPIGIEKVLFSRQFARLRNNQKHNLKHKKAS